MPDRIHITLRPFTKSLTDHSIEKPSEGDLASDINEFFKIQTIQRHLDDPHIVHDNNNRWEDQPMFPTELSYFKSLIEDQVKSIMLK